MGEICCGVALLLMLLLLLLILLLPIALQQCSCGVTLCAWHKDTGILAAQ